MWWIWLRALFLRLNLFWSLFTLGLSAFSLFFGMWLSERRQKKADRVLKLLKDRVEEQQKFLYAEYRLKQNLMNRKIDYFLDLHLVPAVAPFFLREKSKLNTLAQEMEEYLYQTDQHEAISEFDELAAILANEIALYPQVKENTTMQAISSDLDKCQKRILIYRQCYNDAIRIFNMALSHYQHADTTFHFMSVISED